MNLAKLPVFIVLVIQIVHFQADCQKLCSCYTFENGVPQRFSWPQAQSSCKFNKKHLVTMETEREWEFIMNAIQTRKADRYDEWHIGLYRNLTTGNWTWVNGKPLTLDKWQKNNPEDTDFYTLIFKEYPDGHKGSFATVSGNVYRAWICEEETDDCQGVCFFHNPVPTTSTPVTTTADTTQTGRETSTAYDHTNVSDSITTTSLPGAAEQKDDDDNPSTIVIVAATLAALFFVVLVVLAVVLLLRRKKRSGHGEDAEIPKKKSSHQKAQLGENQYETVDRVEAAKLLGTPDKPRPVAKKKDEHELPPVNCEYAVVNKKDKKVSPDKSRPVAKNKDEHELPTVNYEYAVVNKKDKKVSPDKSRPVAKNKDEHELPPVNCEYAVVNKKDKKRKDGDLVYAQLAEFDDDNKETNPHKPPSYEPTVYADVDVVAPEVFSRADSDSTQPTYANVQTTGV